MMIVGKNYLPAALAAPALAALWLLFAGCQMESGGGLATVPEESAEEEWMEAEDESGESGASLPAVRYLKPKIIYYKPAANMAAEFTFDTAVSVAARPGWNIYGNNTATITVAPASSAPAGEPAEVSLSVSAVDRRPGVTKVAEVIPVSGVFSRAGNRGTYTVAYYDDTGVAGLSAADPESSWFYVGEDNEDVRNILDAVYTPNSPESSDSAGNGKTAVPYTPELSRAVLSLFNVTFGADPRDDSIEMKGDALPDVSAHGAEGNRFIAIDVGRPSQGADTGALPVFRIPPRGLGSEGVDAGHIRLRVHRGARLVVEAAWSDGADGENGQPVPCLPGFLGGAWGEVMSGGFLRLGAYEGFPLGEGLVIMSRLGSSIAVGPEAGSPGYDAAIEQERGGLFVGPGGGARITWDGGDQNGDGAEIHTDKLALSANVTVRKSVTLRHSVWLVSGPSVTISVPDGGGLFSGGPDYRIYGSASRSGGQNPARPAAKIIVSRGSSISRSFFDDEAGEDSLITASGGGIEINNKGRNESPVEFTALGKLNRAYLNWNIPLNNEE
jgi:hypothetical protein